MSALFEFDGMQDKADGIDFVPIWYSKNFPPPIIKSYTKEEFEQITCYPKSNRRYWVVKNGKKVYID